MTDKRLSVTHTGLIWTGVILVLVGLVMTLFGIADDATAFEATILDIAELRTSHIGLIFIVIGAFLSGIVSIRLPPDVRVFRESKQSLTEKVAENALVPSAVLGSVALLALILSITLQNIAL